MSKFAFSVKPKALFIAPMVPIYCFAFISEIPNSVMAVFENSFTLSFMDLNAVSTTFCTSDRFEPNSRQLFVKAPIATPPSRPATFLPTPLNGSVYLLVNSAADVLMLFIISLVFMPRSNTMLPTL